MKKINIEEPGMTLSLEEGCFQRYTPVKSEVYLPHFIPWGTFWRSQLPASCVIEEKAPKDSRATDGHDIYVPIRAFDVGITRPISFGGMTQSYCVSLLHLKQENRWVVRIHRSGVYDPVDYECKNLKDALESIRALK